MKRLTTKVDDIYTCSYCENQQAVNRLAEFEDFMEKYNVESMEDLELRLEDIEHYAYNCNVEQIDEIIKLKQENQALQYRWEKLKEWAGYLCYFELVDRMEELEKE